MSSFIFLDSRDSLATGRANQFDWSLTGVNNQLTQNILFSVDQFTMPNSRYVIHTYNKFLYVQQNGGGTQIATLTEGNYTATTLATEMKTRLDALGINTFTITYSSTTQKYTISVGVLPNVVQFVAGSYNPYSVIGLDLNVHKSAVNNLVFSSQVNLAGTQFIDIVCTSIPNPNIKSGTSYPLLWRVPCNVPIGSLIYWEDYSNRNVKVSPYQLDNLSITILDDEGNPYDLDTLHPLTLVIKLSQQPSN